MTAKRYWIDKSKVVHDVFDDGEVAVINLLSGRYYSLTGTAPALWPHLVDGATVDELVAFVASRFDPSDVDIAPAIAAFVDMLRAENLVESGVIDDESGTGLAAIGDAVDGGPRPRFEVPLIERFDDLEELILLDPVHDVGDLGWPHAPAG